MGKRFGFRHFDSVNLRFYERLIMVNKHCCYGICNNDSRKSDICLREGITFIQFPDPSMEKSKAERWVAACRRENFTVASITRWTFVCNKHFVDSSGPTKQNPDPVPATTSRVEADGLRRRQRKASKERPARLSKKQKFDIANTLLTLQDYDAESSTTCSMDTDADVSAADVSITTEQVSDFLFCSSDCVLFRLLL